MRIFRAGLFVLVTAAGGCGNITEEPTLPEGNETLGIVKFVEEDVGDQTTLRGVGADGNEVARLDLVHGRFTVTPPFTDDYNTPQVDGRQLKVHALEQRMHWETSGFEPVLEMPAHPPSQWAIAAFLADPHAKHILDRWQIGFEPSYVAGDGEVAYDSGSFRGDSPQTCDGLSSCGVAKPAVGAAETNCGDANDDDSDGTINDGCPILTCGAGGSPFQARRLTQQSGSNCGLYTGPTNPEVRVAQCCPSSTGILGVPWFAQKVCPTSNTMNTSCGTVPSGVCKGCPTYPVDSTLACSMTTGSTVGTCGQAVYPLNWSFTTKSTYVKASNTELNDHFGENVTVSADGNTFAVWSSDEDSGATGINGSQGDNSEPNSGAVYVFVRSGTTWAQQAYIKGSNTESNDQFGHSLRLSSDGNTLAVGAEGEDSSATGINGPDNDSSSGSGAVYVFTRSGTTWTQQAYIKASNTGSGDAFGFSVGLSSDGNTLAVGAEDEDSDATGINGSQNNNNSSSSGAAYVFTRSGTVWTQQAYVKASNTGSSDSFGTTVTLSGSGSTLAVGALDEDSNATGINGSQSNNSATGAGAVYVYTRSGTVWTQQAYVKASNTEGADEFSASLALSNDGNLLAVGAIDEDSDATGINGDQTDNSNGGSGAVYVFTRSGTTWSQQAYVKASNTDGGDIFGCAVALTGDGNTLAVGARQEESNATLINGNQSDNSLTSTGAVYRFSRFGTSWYQDRYIKASNTGNGDNFGVSVALPTSDSMIVIGAYDESSAATGIGGNQSDNSAALAGAVYVFQ